MNRLASMMGGGKNAMATMAAMQEVSRVVGHATSRCGTVAVKVNPVGKMDSLDIASTDADASSVAKLVVQTHNEALQDAQRQAAEILQKVDANMK